VFQKISLDEVQARNLIDNLIATVKQMRTNCEFGFSIIFNNVKSLITKLNVTIDILTKPKRRQLNRNNVPNTGPEDFYRKTVYIPLNAFRRS
jgi:hypothetical protein